MPKSVCLNMIVKDEAKVIRRCLESVAPFIDCWTIVDTGSTDGTQDIIRDTLRHKPGQLLQRPWKDFGSNRTEAIALAKGTGDYLFFMDASDVLVLPEGYARPELSADAYFIKLKYGALLYERKALVSQRLAWRYVGVLHEYIHTDEPHLTARLEGPVILPNFGEAALTPEQSIAKYKAHTRILEKALKTEPENDRYVFYLAQSYRDSGALDQAIEAYRRRSRMGRWEEEVWYSKYQIAVLAERLGKPEDMVVAAYLEAFQFRPARAEPLVELARLYRTTQRYELALLFASRAAQIPLGADILFVEHAAYDWRALDELSIAQYWTGDFAGSRASCVKLLASGGLPDSERPRVEANRTYAEQKLAVPGA